MKCTWISGLKNAHKFLVTILSVVFESLSIIITHCLSTCTLKLFHAAKITKMA